MKCTKTFQNNKSQSFNKILQQSMFPLLNSSSSSISQNTSLGISFKKMVSLFSLQRFHLDSMCLFHGPLVEGRLRFQQASSLDLHSVIFLIHHQSWMFLQDHFIVQIRQIIFTISVPKVSIYTSTNYKVRDEFSILCDIRKILFANIRCCKYSSFFFSYPKYLYLRLIFEQIYKRTKPLITIVYHF